MKKKETKINHRYFDGSGKQFSVLLLLLWLSLLLLVKSEVCIKLEDVHTKIFKSKIILFCCRWLILDCCCFFIEFSFQFGCVLNHMFVCDVCVCWFVYESWFNGGNGSSSGSSNSNRKELGILKWLLRKTHYLELWICTFTHTLNIYWECIFINTGHIFAHIHAST